MLRIGFIGVGTIASAFVTGLRRARHEDEIVLSPRSEANGRQLVERFKGIRPATSNAEVVAVADVVFLAMRPAQVEEALDGLRFREDQVLASFVTGLSVPDLAALAPHSHVARVLPLPMIAEGRGPVICFPSNDVLLGLLRGLGDVIVPKSEAELRAMGAASGFMSTFFELQNALSGWLGERGVPPSEAHLYVASMLSGLAEVGRATPFDRRAALPAEFETKGGLNARTRGKLKTLGWFDEPGRAFEDVAQLGRSGLA